MPRFLSSSRWRLGDLLVALEDHLARGLVDEVDGETRFTASSRIRSFGSTWIHSMPASTMRRTAAAVNLRSLRASTRAVVGLHLARAALPDQLVGIDLLQDALAVEADRLRLVEEAEQLLLAVAERLEQHRDEDLAAPVDARVDEVLVVELEIEPRAAVRDDAAGVDLLAAGGDRRWTCWCRRRCRASGAAGRRSRARCR